MVDLLTSKAGDCPALTLYKLLAVLVALYLFGCGVVRRPVDLNNNPAIKVCEVYVVGAYLVLAGEGIGDVALSPEEEKTIFHV